MKEIGVIFVFVFLLISISVFIYHLVAKFIPEIVNEVLLQLKKNRENRIINLKKHKDEIF
jgi:Na+-transporting methylmalonyl-CoA/oxaloacetate decarboxylase gamma subunit